MAKERAYKPNDIIIQPCISFFKKLAMTDAMEFLKLVQGNPAIQRIQ